MGELVVLQGEVGVAQPDFPCLAKKVERREGRVVVVQVEHRSWPHHDPLIIPKAVVAAELEGAGGHVQIIQQETVVPGHHQRSGADFADIGVQARKGRNADEDTVHDEGVAPLNLELVNTADLPI